MSEYANKQFNKAGKCEISPKLHLIRLVLDFFHARITSFSSLIGSVHSVFSLSGTSAVQKSAISLFTYSPIHFKKAFTLTEVLITLGIIGVVAALTMPTLIQKHGLFAL